MTIAEILAEAEEEGFEFPYSESAYLLARVAKNAGAHGHDAARLVALYRQQIELANAHAYLLSTWKKCVKDFGDLDFPAWHELYDIYA